MFGDVGHALLMLLFSAFLVLKEKKLASSPLGDIGEMAFGGRYVLLLMSLFSLVTGKKSFCSLKFLFFLFWGGISRSKEKTFFFNSSGKKKLSTKKNRPLLQRVLLDPDEPLRLRQVGLPYRPRPDEPLAHALRPLPLPLRVLRGPRPDDQGRRRETPAVSDLRGGHRPGLARRAHRAPVPQLGQDEDEHRAGGRADERRYRDEPAEPEVRARPAVDADRVHPPGAVSERALWVPLFSDLAEMGDGVDRGPLPHAYLHVSEPR